MLSYRARVDLEAMAMKGYLALPKATALLEPHHQIVLCHIKDTHCGVRVFYSPSRLGNYVDVFSWFYQIEWRAYSLFFDTFMNGSLRYSHIVWTQSRLGIDYIAFLAEGVSPSQKWVFKVWLHSILLHFASSVKCRFTLRCNYFQVHSNLEW